MLEFLKREKKIRSRGNLFYMGFGEDMLHGEEGYLYADMGEGEGNHMIGFGASGSGKTVFLARKTYEEIRQGFQVFCIDPKGSRTWFASFLKACYREGILYDRERGPVVLALPYPEVSFRFNPLQDLTDIYNYIGVDDINELRNRVLADVGNWGEYREQALTALNKISAYDPQFFPRVNSSLRTYLTRLITGQAGKILNVRVEKNLLRERLEAGNLRFYAFLNAEAMKQTAYDVARLLFAWLLTYVGYKSARLEIVKPQLRANIDEVTEIGFYEINKAIRLVRERNVSVCLMTQSPSGLISAFKEKGREIVSDIINSCEVRFFMKMNDPGDMEYASRFAPEVNRARALVHKNSVSVFQNSSVYLFYSPPERDPLRVKVVWTDDPEKVKADVVVNMKRIKENWEVEELGKPEDEVLTVIMNEIKKNYEVREERSYTDDRVREFYEEFQNRIVHRRKEFLKCLDFVDSVKGKKSVVKGSGVLKRVSLLDHSLRVARKAWDITGNTELSQSDRELVFLASLAHDFGKAIADEKTYATGDHPRLTERILTGLEVSPELILLASRHHERDLGDMTHLLQLVKKADYEARKEEENMVRGRAEKEGSREFDFERFRSMVEREINTNEDYIAFTSGDRIFLEKEWVRKIMEQITGNRNMEDKDIETLTGGDFVNAAVFLRNREIKKAVYLTVPLWDANLHRRKKERKDLFAGFSVRIVE